MACSSGSNIVTNGLILKLDAANRNSNIRAAGNMINNSGWSVGYSQTGGWPSNGDAAQNEILYDTDPWGNSSLVLKTHPNNSTANGGWEGITPGYWVSIDRTKKYRSCVWVRRVSSNTNGTFYHGLHTDGTGDVIQSDGSTNGNPYWACQNIGYFSQNQWYLHIGHIFPCGSTPTVDPTSGYWTNTNVMTYIGNPGCNITGADPRFPNDASLLRQRTYHFYANDSASNIELFNPRIDLCDGTEPSIRDILNTGLSQWKDLSGNSNTHYMTYTPPFNTTNRGYFSLDGSTQGFVKAAALSGASTSCTVVIVYSTTDGTELWTMGNQSGSFYLSASYGNAYYHGGCGTPTNYVDLNSVSNPVTEGYRNGNFHMWEAKGVDFSSWTYYQWFLYGGGWQLLGNVACILVYNRSLSAAESKQNFAALRGRYSI